MIIRIVLIHLGSYPPVHFFSNLNYLMKNFENLNIDLITSHKIEIDNNARDHVKNFLYNPAQEVKEKLDRLESDLKFREGFWRYSIERLFALAQHASNFPEDSFLHIESDTLILPGFPFEKFLTVEKLSWTRYDDTRDLATLIWIPDRIQGEWLFNEMLRFVSLSPNMNDMILLNTIAVNNPSRIEILPSAPNENAEILCETYFKVQHEKKSISSNFEKFEGIFDAAALGIWLTGTDPRNYFGFIKRFNTEELLKTATYIDPSKIRFEFSLQNGLSYQSNESQIRIFNLHVHSKNIQLFALDWDSHLAEMVKNSLKNKSEQSFSLRIFKVLIGENARNRTLIRFILWLPGFRGLKRLSIRRFLAFLR